MVRIEFPFLFPSLNEVIAASKRRVRCGKRSVYQYSMMKREIQARVKVQLFLQGVGRIKEYPVGVHFIWHEPTKKRDKDNVAGGGRKFILDGLVSGGVLAGDGWGYVESFTDAFLHDRAWSGVEVFIEERNG